MEEQNNINNGTQEQPQIGDFLLCKEECMGFTQGRKYQVVITSQDGQLGVMGDDGEVNYIDNLQCFEPCEAGDAVNHPAHYNREGAMETIDEMVALFGKQETIIFCKLNAWKYRERAMYKGGEEDMKKSDWYIKKAAELQGILDEEY